MCIENLLMANSTELAKSDNLATSVASPKIRLFLTGSNVMSPSFMSTLVKILSDKYTAQELKSILKVNDRANSNF